jgi:formate dehydrogenase subunit delta
MNTATLVRMANDISAFFAAESNTPEEGARSVLGHLRKFWDPRMRTEIVAHYRSGGDGLTDLARSAVALLDREGVTR